MISLEEQYELFDAYLENSISAEEQSKLNELLQDNAISENFEAYKHLVEAYQRIEQNNVQEQSLLNTINNVRNDAGTLTVSDESKMAQKAAIPKVEAPKFTFTKSLKYIGGVAAVFLIGFFVLQQIGGNTKSGAQLFEQNYSIDNLSNERGDIGLDSVQKAIDLYNAKQFVAAQTYLHNINTKANNADLQLAEAICAIENSKAAEAEQLLQTIINRNDNFKEKAEWYLALLYLQQNDIAKAKQMLSSFNDGHFYKEKASAIVKELD
jgi:hypothetical protein